MKFQISDYEMTFHPDDNWSSKVGSGLVTAAMVLSNEANAPNWLSRGLGWINACLADKGTDGGWYRESPHYINYTLNNLASAAWHVERATGTDWFDDLAPFAVYAIQTRQPDGWQPAFEEGIPNVYPHDVLWGKTPGIGGEMRWAWDNSAKNPVNFDNQQIHSVTRFIMVDDSIIATPPSARPSACIEAEANTMVLRSDYTAAALQANLICSKDYQSGGTASRHNTQNPMDVSISAFGEVLVPTSSGGPTVTSSANRNDYLDPQFKNLVLVDGSAPYVTTEADITLEDFVDGDGLSTGQTSYAVFGAMSVANYNGADRVERLTALIDEELFVFVDRMNDATTHAMETAWHPRGTRSVVASAADHLHLSWAQGAVALDMHSLASAPMSLNLTSGWYVPLWNNEVATSGFDAQLTGVSNAAIMTLALPRSGGPAPTVTPLVLANGAAAQLVIDGTQHRLAARPSAGLMDVAGLTANAAFASIKTIGGVVKGFAMQDGLTIADTGISLLTSDQRISCSARLGTNTAAIILGKETPGAVDLTIDWNTGLDATRAYKAEYNGSLLPASRFRQTVNGLEIDDLVGGGRLLISDIGPAVIDDLSISTDYVLYWSAENGLFYRLESAPEPAGPWSVEASNLPGVTPISSFSIVPIALSDRRFYRVVVEP